MRISDWSSDVCSSDLHAAHRLDVRAVIVAHFRVLRLAAHRPPLVAILGIGGGDRLAPRQPGNRGGSGVIIVELADQPVLRILDRRVVEAAAEPERSEEHTSELQSLMRISYAVFCSKKKKQTKKTKVTYMNTL